MTVEEDLAAKLRQELVTYMDLLALMDQVDKVLKVHIRLIVYCLASKSRYTQHYV